MRRRLHREVPGAIYDMDDTLLRNQVDPADPLTNLHQLARLAAIHDLGYRHEIPELLEVAPEESYQSFMKSPTHTVSGALWVILRDHGIVGPNFDPDHPLIQEMLVMKNTEYARLLQEYGRPIEGAVEFVRDFSEFYGFGNRNALASTGIAPDARTFLGMTALDQLIPEQRRFTLESVTKPKPDPEVFNKAFLSLGLPESARRLVPAFEDDPRGMLAARKAGLIVCAITTRFDRTALWMSEAKPDFIADSFAEFRDIFRLPPLPE